MLWRAAKGTWAVSNAAGTGIANAVNNRMTVGARQGILGPWDPAPPPRAARQGGLWDYRGVAKPGDIGPVQSGFPLGLYREPKRWVARKPIRIPPQVVNEHTAVLGPTRSGKTASVIAPWIYQALALGYTVVASDVKGGDDLLAEVKRYSAHTGPLGAPVIKWDYTDPSRSVSWNWIATLQTDSQINAAVEAICGRPSPTDPNKFFHQSAIKYLRGLLQLAPTLPGNTTLSSILSVLNDQTQLEALIHARQGHPGAGRLRELAGLSAADFIKYTMELKTHLEVLDTTGFAAVTRGRQFDFDLLRRDQPVLLIVNAPVSDGQLADAASGLFFGQFTQQALTGFGTVQRPILLALDEAARLQTRINLGSTLSLIAGYGISVLLAAQDVSQFDDDSRDEILSNCGTMVCLPRVSKSTSEYFVGRLGETRVETVSRTMSTGRFQRGQSWTRTTERSVVLGHREIASPPSRFGSWSATVHAPTIATAPILVDLTRRDLVR